MISHLRGFGLAIIGAGRVGLIRGELEDLSFRYLDPDAFTDLDRKLASKRKVFDKFLQDVQESIRNKIVETGIPVEVQARVKRF